MKNQLLKQFYEFEGQREAVKEFLIEQLGELAKEKAFDGQSTSGIVEAKEAILKLFDKLSEMYDIIPPVITHNTH